MINPFVIAIDGRATAGKTTYAKELANATGASIIHMDDFFLPAELRTPERLTEPGGNIHYERFAEEVLLRLRWGVAFSYKIFNCKIMDYDGVRDIFPTPWIIVEGAYSHHPFFGEYMDLRIFKDIDAVTQFQRILERDGEAKANIFATEWIPLEEKYLSVYNIREMSRLVL